MPLAAPHSVIALLALCCAWHSARAAQDYDNCTGFVDSLPATISTQGTWCLRRDLSTGLSSGAAITIAANNVTLDCNDFKLGGLAAGIATQTVGILVLDRSNNTVRNCAIRGFYRGIRMTGSHHVVEDNRLEGNTATGILMTSTGSSLIRRNRIVDTGGTPHASSARAISTLGTVDILDNIIHGVLPTSGGGDGIRSFENDGGAISRNRIRGIGGSPAHGISLANGIRVSVDTPMTWHQAHEFCASIGAHMLTTATFEDASVPWLTDLGAGWLGATDETSPGTWTWNTGEAFAYTNWATGEPANGHHYLALHESLDLTWVALDADALRVPICEYPPAAAAVLRRNHITGIAGFGSTGVYGTNCRAKDNVYIAASADSCGDAGGNHWVP